MYAKPNTVKFEDSNIANLGTELEKKVKLNAAKCEHAWDGAGSKAGSLEVWRIEKFQIVRWAEKDLGKFFNGDSYIILHTYKKNKNTDALAWDVHFWLGEKTTQDEYGTAAYKTVELDDRLGGAPVQHREVQGHESPLFLSYFPNNTLEIMEGGVESGFTHVEATTYKTRLLHVKGTARAVRVIQVPLSADSLNSGDVFILDDGLKIYQWNGKQSSTYEKVKAGQVVRAMRDERGSKPVCTMHSEGDKDLAEFWSKLGGERPVKPATQGGADEQAAQEAISQKKLFRLSDSSGKAEFTLVKSGEIRKTDLDSNDVFIVDTGAEVFVWIGRKSSTAERKLGMQYAQQYISNNNLPSFLPISRVLEGGENPVFNSLFSDSIATRDLFGVESEEGFPHSCCPHTPGSNKWDFTKTQSSATTSLLKQLAPRSTPGAQPTAQPEQINAAVNELFGFFANKVSTHFK